MLEEILLKDGVRYKLWTPENEPSDFEPMIKYHIKDIFGNDCKYFPKRKLKTLADNRAIPDGFVIDFNNRRWYIVELKLLCDDAVRRIAGQIVDYKNALRNPATLREIYKSIKSVEDASFLDDLINDEKPEIIVIIDSRDGRLGEQFKEKVEGVDSNVKTIVFKTFAREHVNPKMVHIHLFEPLCEESSLTGHKHINLTKSTEQSGKEESSEGKIKSHKIIGTIRNVKAKKDKKDRFEIRFNKKFENVLPYGKTEKPEGYPIKIIINEQVYTIGFHKTNACTCLSSRLDRDGYNLTDLLKQAGFSNKDKVVLTEIEEDTYKLTKSDNLQKE